MFCVLLLSCGRRMEPANMIPSDTVEVSSPVTPTLTTVTSTLNSIPTRTPILPPAATLMRPYPTKQVLLDYIARGYHSNFEHFFPDGINKYSKLVLYTDGQIIFLRDGRYQQARMTAEEVKGFFFQLEALGFYSIESNQEYDDTDKLYNFAGKYEEVGVTDGLLYCILAKGEQPRTLCVYEPYLEYLIPAMRTIVDFIDGYGPDGTSPYYPDRILMMVEGGRDSYDTDLPQQVIPWTESSLSLDLSCQKKICSKVIFVEGDQAKELYSACGSKVCMFSEKGKEYTVQIRAVLPHEELTRVFEQ